MGEPCSCIDEFQSSTGLNSGTIADRRHWPYHLLYAALLIGQAILQIALVLFAHP
jgi:hypothetical protein